jgi:hypothetical protein
MPAEDLPLPDLRRRNPTGGEAVVRRRLGQGGELGAAGLEPVELVERPQETTMFGAQAAQVSLKVAAQGEIRRRDPATDPPPGRGWDPGPGTKTGICTRRHGKRTW